MTEPNWEKIGCKIIRIELEKRNMNYIDLHKALENIGISQSLPSMRNKLARGGFSVTFFVQCLAAMGVDILQFSQYDPCLKPIVDKENKPS